MPDHDDEAVLRISPARVAKAMAGVAAVLLVGHLAAVYVEYGLGHDGVAGTEVLVRVLGMDGELNAPTWWSASALLGCAVLAGLLAHLERSRERAWHRHWLLVAAVLAFLSLDEAALLHEELSRPLTRSLDLDASRWEYWAWLGPYVAGAAALAAVLLGFVRRLPTATRRPLVAGGALFVAAAGGLELVGRELWEGEPTVPYLLLVGVEEVLEMLAVVLVAYALLTHLSRQLTPVRVIGAEWQADVRARGSVTFEAPSSFASP